MPYQPGERLPGERASRLGHLDVLKSDLVHLVEEVPGVEGVESLEIRDELRNVGVEHLRLDDDELPFLVHVQVAEKVRDDIK